MCKLGIFLSKFGCQGNFLCPLENLDSILQVADPRKPYYSQERFPDFLHRTEISAILADFCLNLVAMVTAFEPLKIPIVYLNSPTLKTLYTTHAKTLSLFYTKLKCVKFWLILPKFGCHGNVLCSLKTSDSIFEFYNPEKPINM